MVIENANFHNGGVKFLNHGNEIIGYIPDEDGNYGSRDDDSSEVAWISWAKNYRRINNVR